jgi:hypothetical protein
MPRRLPTLRTQVVRPWRRCCRLSLEPVVDLEMDVDERPGRVSRFAFRSEVPYVKLQGCVCYSLRGHVCKLP